MKTLVVKAALAAALTIVPGIAQSPIGVQNYAGFSPSAPVAPGSIISIYGNFTGVALQHAPTTNPLPKDLGGVRVRIAGIEAPIYYVSPVQINAVVPYATPANGRQSVEVVQGGTVIAAGAVLVFDYAPALPSRDSTQPSRLGIVQNASQNSVDNSESAPARRGEVIVIYATGCGVLNPAPADGAAPPAAAPAVATAKVIIGAAEVTPQYAGGQSQYPGICQVNATIPDHPSIISGRVPLVLTINGVESNWVTLWVQ